MITCDHGNSALLKMVESLPECQSGIGRHKCAICAYQAGMLSDDTSMGASEACDQDHATVPNEILHALPSSQAGHHRHKCVYQAYKAGREQRLRQSVIAEAEELVVLSKNEEIEETTREQLVLARRGQGAFRQSVLRISDTCWATGVSDERLLRASHIKPWRSCSNEERLDGYNGFMLSPHVDHLFDSGWITLDDQGRVSVAEGVSADVLAKWGIVPDKCSITLKMQHLEYLAYHRENIFKG